VMQAFMLLVRCLPCTFFVEIIYRIMPEMGMRTAVVHEIADIALAIFSCQHAAIIPIQEVSGLCIFSYF